MESTTYRGNWFEPTGDAWEGSRIAAYRVWVRKLQGVWQQRHEWKFTDGTVSVEDWISSITPSPAWLDHAEVIPSEEAA